MKTLYDGTQVSDDTLTGMNGSKYPRLDEDGKQLDGHGAYALTAEEIAIRKAETVAYEAETPKREAQQKLQELDAVLPRDIEDMIQGLNINKTALPEVMQNRLVQKRNARDVLSEG